MNSSVKTLVTVAGSIVVGLVAFVAITVLVTEGLEPYVWPSLLVGLPAGVVAGVAAAVLTFLGANYSEERRTETGVSQRTAVRLRAALGAIAGFVVGGGLGTAAFALWGGGLAGGTLFVGLPAGLLAAAVAGYVAARSGGRGETRQAVLQ